MRKRAFDITCSLLGLVILSAPLMLIAVVIAITDPGPVFFRQERVGRNGRSFRIWKFRTMVVDAERLGAQITVGRDPRITRIGALLRKTKFDELPQLLNVFVGEMSLVGPRPEVPRYVALYSEEQLRVLQLTPGITDEASIAYRDEASILAASDDPQRTYIEQVMPDKIRINLDYASKSSVWTDLLVVLRTVFLK